ncbi:MAG: S-methyl-5-thioribose-1-phosphate isomerase [Thermoanaerobaculaceae bacterium]|nr:S-methyl-5-thioribose-1-phosphate isomerase [Thermoanaerobaculaceae bacterium]MDI9622406.1 S-methyl-5-thioribose-1-phosphate isomerase [Acidobacteriota bacterium]NLH11161.1 S-methyl-5-thioribose-1-phosphate isomerase [Holophagae bacterium]HPW54307.1 S-methyl-5-thioribose-1-phosphate isomerase [Thermoanaerobaculaceae bacterium]
MTTVTTRVEPLRWGRGLEVLDQRQLPWRQAWIEVRDAAHAVHLIRALAVRGAPLLGITAAYALALEALRTRDLPRLRIAAGRLAAARPTAVNLARAVHQVMAAVEAARPQQRASAAVQAAITLHGLDAVACQRIGELGARLFRGEKVSILTHCNTGALATGGIGTALGVVRTLHAQGRLGRVFACEARPVLQGARLTVWECQQDDLPVTLLPDHAAATLLASGQVDGVVLGADRIAADGAVANKLGTYPLAVLAARHGVPLVSAAPLSTFDLACPDGRSIPIEQRDGEEVRRLGRHRVVDPSVPVFNPAFDVTPPELVSAIVCERGIVRPVTRDTVREAAG